MYSINLAHREFYGPASMGAVCHDQTSFVLSSRDLLTAQISERRSTHSHEHWNAHEHKHEHAHDDIHDHLFEALVRTRYLSLGQQVRARRAASGGPGCHKKSLSVSLQFRRDVHR